MPWMERKTMVTMAAMEWKWNRYGDIMHLVPIATEVGVTVGKHSIPSQSGFSLHLNDFYPPPRPKGLERMI